MRFGHLVAFVCAAAFVAVAQGEERDETPLPPGAEWYDDWYAVQRLDAETIAISEPRYDQHNVNYLIIGSERALLFDTGPGERDIRPLASKLAGKPVVTAFSHLHFDHIGGTAAFDAIGSLDRPEIRNRTDAQGNLTPSLLQHGGLGRPTFRISEWWPADSSVDLGARSLQVLSTPGHTPESLTLYDRDRGILFTGDLVYPGDLYAWVPGSDLSAYRDSLRRLIALGEATGDIAVYGAHVPTSATSPRQTLEDLRRIEAALTALIDGHPPQWELIWFSAIPLRRYSFGPDLAVQTRLVGW